jgi:hypothetical protein
VHGRVAEMLAHAGLLEAIGPERIFRTLDSAVAAFTATEAKT